MRSDRDTGYGVDYFTRDHPWLGRWYVPLCEWERTMGIERNFRDRDSLRVPDGIFLGASASNVEHDTAVETVKARTAEYRSKCSDYADRLKANDSARYLRDTADSIRQEVRANDDRITKIIDQLNMIEDAIVNDERNSND